MDHVGDFLEFEYGEDGLEGATVFMNPPFSKGEQFVKKAFELGSRKIVCFQRFAWFESQDRKQFWDEFPPEKIYVCGNRADCWRFDIKPDAKGFRYDPSTGKKLNGTTTAHAWFVFTKDHKGGTIVDRIYK